MVTRALAHGLLAGRCDEVHCVDCARPEEWCRRLNVCGGFSDFLVIRVLKVQKIQHTSDLVSVVGLFLLRLYDGIRTEASRVNAEAATFRQDRGEMKHDLSLRYGKCFGLIPFLGWIETISLLVFFAR